MESMDMRGYPRFQVCCPSHLITSGADFTKACTVSELSEGGAFVRTRQALRKGERVYLRLNLDEDQVAGVTGEVTWGRQCEKFTLDAQPSGFGVRFVEIHYFFYKLQNFVFGKDLVQPEA